MNPASTALHCLLSTVCPMNVDLEHLIILQAQDLELRRLRAELADAPA